MLSFVNKYAANIHSQNGESGLVNECVRRLGIERGRCVEAGCNDGFWLSNTAHLIEFGWSALYVEADYELYKRCVANMAGYRPNVHVQCSRVDAQNINAFVDGSCDLLSLDTDGNDYAIFDGLKAKPKIVIIEIDSSLPPSDEGFNSDGGASYRAMVKLGQEKGYFLLCHTGNLIFVDEQYRDLFPEIAGDPLRDIDLYFNRAWLKEEAA